MGVLFAICMFALVAVGVFVTIFVHHAIHMAFALPRIAMKLSTMWTPEVEVTRKLRSDPDVKRLAAHPLNRLITWMWNLERDDGTRRTPVEMAAKEVRTVLLTNDLLEREIFEHSACDIIERNFPFGGLTNEESWSIVFEDDAVEQFASAEEAITVTMLRRTGGSTRKPPRKEQAHIKQRRDEGTLPKPT